MSIKQIVYKTDFMNSLRRDENASWTYDEAEALYDFYENLSEDIGEDIEVDHVMVRCEWSSYNNFDELREVYDDSLELYTLEDFKNNTSVIELKDSILIQEF